MRIAFVDAYPPTTFRVNKDVNGGFGTGNQFGDNVFTFALERLLKRGVVFPPLYLVSTLSVLSSQGHDCHYFVDISNVDIRSFDAAIFSTSIVAHETEIEIISCLSEILPVIAIGPFAQIEHVTYIESGAHVLLDEPDTSFSADSELIHTLVSTTQPSAFRSEIPPSSLQDLPLLRWDIVFKAKLPRMIFLGLGASLPVFSSRGCPYSCFNYCTYPLQQGRTLRSFPASQFVDRLEYYKRTYNVSRFLIRDPVFTINKQRALDICNEIIRRKLDIVFGAELHLKDLDVELIQLLSRAGLRCVFVGIETVDPVAIKATKRTNTSQQLQLQRINELESAGVSVKAMFIVGMPNDSISAALSTIKYARKIGATYLQMSVFTPYPGTPIYESYKNSITASDYTQYNQWNLVFNHPGLSHSDVKMILGKFYFAAYSSPMRLTKILWRILKASLST